MGPLVDPSGAHLRREGAQTDRKGKVLWCRSVPGFRLGARLGKWGVGGGCCSQVSKKTHYQLQLQDARRKKKKKRAAISAARHENKPTEKSALMSGIYAAGCVGWILPHHPGGRGA